jgi:hypothetical protein
MTEAAKVETFALRQRRKGRCEEWSEQTKLAETLPRYLDPACTFWSALENKPISRLSGMFAKRRGVRSGLPDVHVLYRGKSIYVELKSHRGVASKVQKQVRAELLAAGAEWWMARSAGAALTALHLSGVVFRRPWTAPQLEPWEGPFADPHQRLPQAPDVAAERKAARKRWRERQKAAPRPMTLPSERRPNAPDVAAQRAWRERHKRAREGATLAAERGDAARDDIAARGHHR